MTAAEHCGYPHPRRVYQQGRGHTTTFLSSAGMTFQCTPICHRFDNKSNHSNGASSDRCSDFGRICSNQKRQVIMSAKHLRQVRRFRPQQSIIWHRGCEKVELCRRAAGHKAHDDHSEPRRYGMRPPLKSAVTRNLSRMLRKPGFLDPPC